MTTQQNARVAKISYRLNAARTDVAGIPVGLLVQFQIAPDKSVLVLFARKELTEEERGQMDWVARTALADPVAYLQAEVDAAMAAGGDAFARLAEKFCWSLNVSTALEVPIPEDVAEKLTTAVQRLLAASKVAKKAPPKRSPRQARSLASIIISDPTVADFAMTAAPEFSGVGDLSTYVPAPWMLPVSSLPVLSH